MKNETTMPCTFVMTARNARYGAARRCNRPAEAHCKYGKQVECMEAEDGCKLTKLHHKYRPEK